ncbi:MAG: hypothetical protein V2A67_07860 [Bacteroidota bacterium]
MKRILFLLCVLILSSPLFSQTRTDKLDLPDPLIMEAYEKAAVQNVLSSVNNKIFFGYFSVCADGKDFGYGYSYPSLDGHQLTDALLWLDQVDVVKANWDYIKSFQKPDGQLPIAIQPDQAGKIFGTDSAQSRFDDNGGLYRHFVPGDPLRALAGPTYIQNAEVIFRHTNDLEWLRKELPSINLTADHMATLVTKEGAVTGAGYYIERPTRFEYDGVAQCHVADAFRRVWGLNLIAGDKTTARKYMELFARIEMNFYNRFWRTNQFAEYIHPERGAITSHGLSDTDWSSIALEIATPEQKAILWPRLKDEKKFYYGGMPTGIVTNPETYEKWESTLGDFYDLAAMGRVWYVEATARAKMNDATGLIESIRRVCEQGRKDGYYWRERYTAEKGGYGAQKYCEYPANLIRIVQRYLLGVEHRLDGSLSIGPTVPDDFWKAGFGQTLSWQGRSISYKMQTGQIKGEYSGENPQKLYVKLQTPPDKNSLRASINGKSATYTTTGDWIGIDLPAATSGKPCRFEISQ